MGMGPGKYSAHSSQLSESMQGWEELIPRLLHQNLKEVLMVGSAFRAISEVSRKAEGRSQTSLGDDRG